MAEIDIKRLEDSVIGSYRLERLLGAGGFGAVYQAVSVVRGQQVGKPVALKVLHPAGLHPDDPLRELHVMAELEYPHLRKMLGHPGEVVVRDAAGVSASVIWFAMELAEGSLRDRLKQGALPEAQAVGAIAAVARALAFLHRLELAHRDVKPENIMLVGGTWKLGDFGLTRRQASGDYGPPVGTIPYLPPESHDKSPLKVAWDVWALGLTLVDTGSGRPLWHGLSQRQWTNRITADHELELPALPGRLAEIARFCLLKDPARRWTIERVLQALEAEPPQPTPAPTPAPRPPAAAPLPEPKRGRAKADAPTPKEEKKK